MRRRFAYLGLRATILALSAMCAHGQGAATTTIEACAAPPSAEGKSRQRFDSTAVMVVAAELEAQGEAKFHLAYARPESECQVESFEVADAKIAAIASPLQKGPSTVLYRFVVQRPAGASEVLVLYSGTAGLVAKKGDVFHVSEERDGVISWYAMFRETPAYLPVKDVVRQIVAGEAKPLLAVRWPAGAKEGEMVAFDSKRLK